MSTTSWKFEVASSDADFISETVSRLYAPCRTLPLQPSESLTMRSQFVAYEDFLISKADFKNGIYFSPDTDVDFVMAYVPISGSLEFNYTNKTVDAGQNGIALTNTKAMRSMLFSADRAEIAFMTTVDALCEVVSLRLDRRISFLNDFTFIIDKSTLLGSALDNYSIVISDLLLSPELLEQSPIQMKRCRDAFIGMAIASLDVMQLSEMTERQQLMSVDYVLKAEEFMRHNAKEPIGVVEVAKYVGVSLRSLQNSFRKHRNKSPLATLTTYRLEGLRDQILAGGDSSIGQMAAEWGFVHPSRLSTIYSQQFGELPRDTLRRARAMQR